MGKQKQLKYEVRQLECRLLLTHIAVFQLWHRSFLKDYGMTVMVVKRLSSFTSIALDRCHPAEFFWVINGLVNSGCLCPETETSTVSCDEFATYLADKIVSIWYGLGITNFAAESQFGVEEVLLCLVYMD